MTSTNATRLENCTHGKYFTYMRGCRCRPCVVANAEYGFNLRRRRAEALAADPTIREHGNRTTYVAWGCRCQACVDANTAYRRTHRGRSA